MNVPTRCDVKPRKMRRAYKAYRSRLGPGLCPICGRAKDRPSYSYCRLCWNAYQRAKRPKYKDLSPLQRRRSIIRSVHNVYRRRGKILAEICFACGSNKNIELHHPDIDKKPSDVIPLCRECHASTHNRGKNSLRQRYTEKGVLRV